MFQNLDFSGLIWLAAFGLICAVLLAIGSFGALVWWLVTHVQIV